jgi:hypothetical protein
VDGALELGEHVVAHLVAAGAEGLGVAASSAVLNPPQKTMPPMKPADREEAQAVVDARAADDPPVRAASIMASPS